jgi:hypothetical protein
MADTPNNQQQIPFQAEPQVLKGAYTNNMTVAHTKEEFIMDFMSISYNPSVVSLVAKIITNPAHFKRIVAALTDNLRKYEEKFGKIDSPKPDTPVQQASESSKFGF